MFMPCKNAFRWRYALLAAGALGLVPAKAEPPLSLAGAFEKIWARQPEAQALAQRREAAQALQQAASSWTPAPPALEAALRRERLNGRNGAQELELGLAVPLWLPGERQRTQALAQAQAQGVEAQALLARWQLAQLLRERWWALLAERQEAFSAQARWHGSQQLALDVARRVKAGELSRADQHQADAAVAAARAEQALAQARQQAAEQGLRAWLGLPEGEALVLAEQAEAEPEAEPGSDLNVPPHPLLSALSAQASSARSAAALAQLQSREHPEVTLLKSRERAARGESSTGSLLLGLRLPLGRGERHRAALVQAGAEQTEAEVALAREREQLAAQGRAARSALAAARTVLEATQERARLAQETRGFFERSFRLGQTDLPTQLRVEQEAAQAQRDAARARTALHLALAQLRQSLGLLPE